MFLKLNLFPSSGEGRETPTLLGPLERANLSHWMMEEFQISSDSQCYTLSSEPFRVYLHVHSLNIIPLRTRSYLALCYSKSPQNNHICRTEARTSMRFILWALLTFEHCLTRKYHKIHISTVQLTSLVPFPFEFCLFRKGIKSHKYLLQTDVANINPVR
jgi:hypothetical protein